MSSSSGEDGPGPGAYEDPPEQRVASPPAKHSKQTSNFASGSNRFVRSVSAGEAGKPRLLSKQPVPAAGAYTLPDKWIKRQGVHRTDHMISQVRAMKTICYQGWPIRRAEKKHEHCTTYFTIILRI